MNFKFNLHHFNEGVPVSKVEVTPVTGRRHQIRVHLMHSGHPIVGDNAYSEDRDSFRTFLHAHVLEMPFEPPKPANVRRKKVNRKEWENRKGRRGGDGEGGAGAGACDGDGDGDGDGDPSVAVVEVGWCKVELVFYPWIERRVQFQTHS